MSFAPRSILAVIALACLLTTGTAVRAAESEKLQALTNLFLNFETGFAYLENCTNAQLAVVQHPLYLHNAAISAGALAAQIRVENPAYTETQIQAMISARREEVKKIMRDYYAENGCYSKSAEIGLNFYLKMRKLPIAELHAIIEQLDKDGGTAK